MPPSRARVMVLLLVFFSISLITNILGPLIPDLVQSFGLSLGLAAFLPFSFFLAYGVMSIPAGFWVERWGEKKVMLAAFTLALSGSLTLALVPSFRTGLGALFAIGLGMAALQVAINPLLRVVGGQQNYAFNAVLAQLVFGSASFLSPVIYSRYVQQLSSGRLDPLGRALRPLVPATLPWVAMYWLFAGVILLMLATLSLVSFPRVERTADERSGAWSAYRELAGRPYVWGYFLAIFCYVGLEQGSADWMSQFLLQQHGFDPVTVGAEAVSRFWGLLTLGCLLGLALLHRFDSRRVLLAFVVLGLGTLSAALWGSAGLSRWAFPGFGFCLSVMWSIVFALALNRSPDHHGAFSGILCTGIVGGALVPLVIGSLADRCGLRLALCLLYLPLLYLAGLAIRGDAPASSR